MLYAAKKDGKLCEWSVSGTAWEAWSAVFDAWAVPEDRGKFWRRMEAFRKHVRSQGWDVVKVKIVEA